MMPNDPEDFALLEGQVRLNELIAACTQATWEADRAGRMVADSPSWRLYTGQSAAEWLGAGWVDAVHPDDRDHAERQWRDAIATGHRVNAEFRVHHAASGSYHWTNMRATPLVGRDGEIRKWIGTNIDIHNRKEIEQQQHFLLAELQHRVRNVLATLRAIVRHTGSTSDTVEEYKAHLDGRLAALARVQSLLTRSSGVDVSLETIVRDEFLAQAAADERLAISGPDLKLPPKAAEVVTLAIHELATNATKYGALARKSGRIKVEWSTQIQDGTCWLMIDWKENAPIEETTPANSGFGTELITRRIPYELHGIGTIKLTPNGVRARISFPLRSNGTAFDTAFTTNFRGMRDDQPGR